MTPVRVLVTGANGFVGQTLVQHLLAEKDAGLFAVLAACRQPDRYPGPALAIALPDLDGADVGVALDLMLAQHPVDVVVHLAARVHVMNEKSSDPLASFRAVNVAGSLALAQAAAKHGAKRFVYVSSVKVHGESTPMGQPFTVTQKPMPEDAYGVSKWEAEQALTQLCLSTGMELVVVRPPLIYGPGVKANLAALAKLVQRGIPLPLGGITNNRRSLVGVDNLCSCLLQCIVNPQAVGQAFLVSDGHDLSTADLCRNLALSMGRQPALWSIPVQWLKCLAMLPRLGGVLQRLMGSLQVDIHHTRTTLNWSPPVTVQEGLRRAFAQHEKTL